MPFEKRQLRPGRYAGSHSVPPPAPPVQKTFRGQPKFFEAVEERALRESLLTGLTVTFSDLVRRGLELVLRQPLPERVVGPRVPCGLVPTAGDGVACTECLVTSPTRGVINCPRLCREVRIDEQ